MGAWEAGNFQNDSALDWVGDLCAGGDASTVHTTLSQVIEKCEIIEKNKSKPPSFVDKLFGRRPPPPYLEEPNGTQALAAAEIVACWLGHPVPNLPEKVAEWARNHSGAFSPEFVQLARQAVVIIKTKSELKVLWEEGDDEIATEWHTVIADLERRLQD